MKWALFRSGEVEIDPTCRTLTRNGTPIQPPRKVLDLILFLVRSRGVVVSRESIEEEIWPGVCVSKASLRWLLKEVRRCLGDNGSDQRYIETARGYGLRWVADVEVIERELDAIAGLHIGGAPLPRPPLVDDTGSEAGSRCAALIRVAESQLRAGKFNEARSALLSAAEITEVIAGHESPSAGSSDGPAERAVSAR
jgi:DNA-binding winged helix-turn-helix (wHTH) protein